MSYLNSEFSGWSWRHQTIRANRDYNNILDHAFEKSASYIVRSISRSGVTYYEAVNGRTGRIQFGGVRNTGGANGLDASIVIQAVLDAVRVAGGGKVVLGKGEFGLGCTNNKTLRVGNYTTLQGQGRSTVLKVLDGAWANLDQGPTGEDFFGVLCSQYAGRWPGGTSYGIIIKDLMVDCNQAGQTGLGSNALSGIFLHWATQCIVENVWVKNAWDWGIRTYPSNPQAPATPIHAETFINNVYVESCGHGYERIDLPSTTLTQTEAAGATVFHVASTVGFNVGWLVRIGNIPGSSGDYEWRIIEAIDAVGLTITVSVASWYAHASGSTLRNIELTGGVMTSDGSYLPVRVIMSNLYIKNCHIGIWIEENTGGVEITSAYVNDCWFDGLVIHTVGTGGINVNGGFFNYNAHAGISWTAQGMRILINGATCFGNRLGLEAFQGHENSIVGGGYFENKECGIWLNESNNWVVDGSQILQNGRRGLSAAHAYKASTTTYIDETVEANNNIARNMTLLPSSDNGVNDAYYFGGVSPFAYLTLNVGTAGAGVWTITWEYWNGAWTALAGVTDNTGGFTLLGTRTVTYTLPGDWVLTSVNGKSAYYIRGRVSVWNSLVTQPKGTQAWSRPVKPYGVYVTSVSSGYHHVISACRIGNDVENVQMYGVYEEDGAAQNFILGCNFYNNVTANVRLAVGSKTRLRDNVYLNPIGRITNPFYYDAGPPVLAFIGYPVGNEATPRASVDYEVVGVDIVMSTSDSGNHDMAFFIKDPAGNSINPGPMTNAYVYYLNISAGCFINWGAFTGGAPSVIVSGE